MSEILGFMFMAFFIEGFVTFIKQIVDAKQDIKYTYILAIVGGVLVACLFNLDLLPFLQLNSKVSFAGNIISGLIIARGSNYVNDIYSSFIQKTKNVE